MLSHVISVWSTAGQFCWIPNQASEGYLQLSPSVGNWSWRLVPLLLSQNRSSRPVSLGPIIKVMGYLLYQLERLLKIMICSSQAFGVTSSKASWQSQVLLFSNMCLWDIYVCVCIYIHTHTYTNTLLLFFLGETWVICLLSSFLFSTTPKVLLSTSRKVWKERSKVPCSPSIPNLFFPLQISLQHYTGTANLNSN